MAEPSGIVPKHIELECAIFKTLEGHEGVIARARDSVKHGLLQWVSDRTPWDDVWEQAKNFKDFLESATDLPPDEKIRIVNSAIRVLEAIFLSVDKQKDVKTRIHSNAVFLLLDGLRALTSSRRPKS